MLYADTSKRNFSIN